MATGKYMGYTYRKTDCTTTVYKHYFGRIFPTATIAHLYEIDGLKQCGQRPFLTSVDDVKNYIREYGSCPGKGTGKTNAEKLSPWGGRIK